MLQARAPPEGVRRLSEGLGSLHTRPPRGKAEHTRRLEGSPRPTSLDALRRPKGQVSPWVMVYHCFPGGPAPTQGRDQRQTSPRCSRTPRLLFEDFPGTGLPPPWLWHRYGNLQKLPRPTANPTLLRRYWSLLSHLGLSSPLLSPRGSGPGAHAMPGLWHPGDSALEPLLGLEARSSLPFRCVFCYLKENRGAS